MTYNGIDDHFSVTNCQKPSQVVFPKLLRNRKSSVSYSTSCSSIKAPYNSNWLFFVTRYFAVVKIVCLLHQVFRFHFEFFLILLIKLLHPFHFATFKIHNKSWKLRVDNKNGIGQI